MKMVWNLGNSQIHLTKVLKECQKANLLQMQMKKLLNKKIKHFKGKIRNKEINRKSQLEKLTKSVNQNKQMTMISMILMISKKQNREKPRKNQILPKTNNKTKPVIKKTFQQNPPKITQSYSNKKNKNQLALVKYHIQLKISLKTNLKILYSMRKNIKKRKVMILPSFRTPRISQMSRRKNLKTKLIRWKMKAQKKKMYLCFSYLANHFAQMEHKTIQTCFNSIQNLIYQMNP